MRLTRKINIEQTFDRYLAFYERRLDDGIIAHVTYPIAQFANPGETRKRGCLVMEDLDGCIARWRDCNIVESLADSIPCIYPTLTFGEAIWSGMLGGDIAFVGNDLHTWSTCEKPVIESIDDFDFTPISDDNIWFRRLLDVTKNCAQHMEPVFDICHFIIYDCLNLLVELRGAAVAFMDLYDHPDFVSRFCEWSVTENVRVFDAQGALSRGFVKTFYQDHPCYKYAGCNIPHMSIDAYGSCPAETYARFGLDYHTRIVDHYGGARFHIHGDARRLAGHVSKITKITECDMGDDVGYPSAYTIVEQLKESMHPIPIFVSIPKEEFLKRLKNRTLPGGIGYRVYGADSVNEANEIMLSCFDYQPIRML